MYERGLNVDKLALSYNDKVSVSERVFKIWHENWNDESSET